MLLRSWMVGFGLLGCVVHRRSRHDAPSLRAIPWMTDTSSDRAVYRSFDNLYDATFQDVLSYCRRRTRTPEDANEATAETYLIAWRKFAELQATAKPVAWLLAVARQVLLNQRRSNDRRDRLVNRLQQQPRTLNVEISKQHEHSEVVAAVLKSLNNLDPLDQEIIALAAFEGLSYQEIAIVVNRTQQHHKK